MFPIRDTIPSSRYPLVNNLLIGINITVFLVQMGMGQGAALQNFVIQWGFIPAKLTNPRLAAHFTTFDQAASFFTFMFLHGGFLHLLSNMWSLYIFGDNVEDRMGHGRYLAFYLLCGLASAVTHLGFNWASATPTVGASGAIAGVMGAYLLLYPRSRILTLVLLIIFPIFVEIPAFFFLGLWFALQFLYAAGGQAGGIAWWAHVGGFLAGMILVFVFTKTPRIGFDRTLRRYTQKRSTPRLQVVRPLPGGPADPHLYGSLEITSQEALLGARKLVNIPWGFQKRLYTVVIPPGLSSGSRLKLAGLGRLAETGVRGDLILEVKFREGGNGRLMPLPFRVKTGIDKRLGS
ncbi:MAG: rhomboid family intramembrane serine protease [Proteobacteria bacterium]|nr:rhomboid family intramembrane serine protease [Pseudomonadota bacterium]